MSNTDAPDAPLEYSAEELLATHSVLEPLIADGRRCHGGFDEHGEYLSPRTLHRVPAIAAWQSNHAAAFGTELLDIELESFPAHYPNLDQAKLLLRNGVREPIIATLSRVGTVEGFGGFLRYSIVEDLQRHFDDDLAGTATAHLERGLIEAHARDEAGHEDEAGHNLMWFAARDIAFEHPMTADETSLMLERMGIAGPGGQLPDFAKLRSMAIANRRLPGDIDFDVESLLERLVRLLLIEINAFHIFSWAEALLSDDTLVAGDGEAARIVSYIRADETPHVGYLKTVLTEMRDRTFVGEGGIKHAGADIISTLWDPAVAESRGARRDEALEMTWQEVRRAVTDDALMEEFEELGDVHRSAHGTWSERAALEATAPA